MSEDIIDLDVVPKGRKGDGGTYLVIADDSEEFKSALLYACASAKNHRARVGILHVCEAQDFQQWGGVEGRIKKELRENGEKYLWSVAKIANDFNGTIPSLYLAEGMAADIAIINAINTDEKIVKLVLGGGRGAMPGPLVSFFTSRGLSKLRVPVVIVPGHLKDFA